MVNFRVFGRWCWLGDSFSAPLVLTAAEAWVTTQLKRLSGNFLARRVVTQSGNTLNTISIYNPHWALNQAQLHGQDLSGILLPGETKVWAADLLQAAIPTLVRETDAPWVIGGDFNLSTTFDAWKPGKTSNRTFLDRMARSSLTECLCAMQGQLTPTFRNPSRGKEIKHQIDHLFVTRELADRLVSCQTGSQERVFESVPALSDHLPIVATYSNG